MAESKYEKYVVREPIRLQGFKPEEWSTTRDSMTSPPFSFLLGDKPIKDANTMVEFTWVWRAIAFKEGALQAFLRKKLYQKNTHK